MGTTVNGVRWENGEGHPLAETCSACLGDGITLAGGWERGYPEKTCEVCDGSGKMVRR